MIKKLQSLLFEDEDEELEDDEIEEEEEVVVRPVVEQPVVKPAPAPAPVEKPVVQPVEEPKQESHFNRIDVTQNIPTQTEKPQVAPIVFPEEPKVEVKKPSIGITVDDDYKAPVVKQKPVVKQQIKPAKPKTQKVTKTASKPSYEFQPVISPIFGVDEKDMTALKNTTQKVNALADTEDDKNTTPVISPIYGSTSRNVVKPVLETETNTASNSVVETKAAAPVEDEIPEFSLDDILKVRDEEYQDNESLENTAPLFPDLTFPEEEEEVVEKAEEVVDQTLVMPKVDKK